MGNKLKSITKSKEENKAQDIFASLPGLVCTTDSLPAPTADTVVIAPGELITTKQFEEYFAAVINQCISSNAKTIALTPTGDYIPLFQFPYTLFNQCSSNLVELDVVWHPLPPPHDWNGTEETYQSMIYRECDPSKITNSFPSDMFDHLPNLKTLNLAGYPFPYLSDKIGNLTNLRSLLCYGSKIMCFPRSMYKLTKLAKFDPYCSYQLHYLPYEMKDCKLNDSRISTGALWNNNNNKQLFPPLPPYPTTFVQEIDDFIFNKQQLKEYAFGSDNSVLNDHLNDVILDIAFGDSSFCSKCKCDIIKEYIYYIWVFERIGTDSVGLLGMMCPNCIEKHVKTQDFIANNTKCDISGDPSEQKRWSRISWGDDVGDNELFLFNKKGTTSAKIRYSYEKHEHGFYKIPPMRVGWKYAGCDYNMDNVSKAWIKFWRYSLLIDFENYELCTNVETNEVNVLLM